MKVTSYNAGNNKTKRISFVDKTTFEMWLDGKMIVFIEGKINNAYFNQGAVVLETDDDYAEKYNPLNLPIMVYGAGKCSKFYRNRAAIRNSILLGRFFKILLDGKEIFYAEGEFGDAWLENGQVHLVAENYKIYRNPLNLEVIENK